IGQALAQRAALGFGMPVLYHSRQPVPAETLGSLAPLARHVPRVELLTRSDFVVCTMALTEDTRASLDAAPFAAMEPGAIFIYCSRGAIVDEAALLAALDSGHLRAAGLDVFATEPLPLDSPLRTHPQVVPLPHAGSA